MFTTIISIAVQLYIYVFADDAKIYQTFSALMIVSCYNIHWLIYRVGLRNGCSI